MRKMIPVFYPVITVEISGDIEAGTKAFEKFMKQLGDGCKGDIPVKIQAGDVEKATPFSIAPEAEDLLIREFGSDAVCEVYRVSDEASACGLMGAEN